MAISRYDSIISEASRRFGVPETHIRSVMSVESGGKPGAVSPKGAAGLMQVMAPTYAELARKHGLGPDRFDPHNNIMAGTAYLGQLHQQFGNWDDVWGAYNAGPGRWSLVKAGRASIPAETAAYGTKVRKSLGLPESTATGDTVIATNSIPRLLRPQPGQTMQAGQVIPQNETELRGLLAVDEQNNHNEGLGGLLGTGQTESQPPGPSVNSRISEILNNLAATPAPKPALSPFQYQLAGAGAAVQPLAGIHDRKVGFGELLGALGGGLTRGSAAGTEAAQAERAAQFGELGNMAKLQTYQRTEANQARMLQAANAFADQLDKQGHHDLAAAVRGNPSLMDEIVKAQAGSIYPKEGGNTTLSPGQVSFDRYGRPIAAVPDRPQTSVVGQGDIVVDQRTGQRIAEGAPKPMTVQLTPEEVAAQRLPPGTIAQKKPDGSIDIVSSPLNDARHLRTEFSNHSKPFIEVGNSFNRLQTSYQNATKATSDELRGPSDIALVFSYMKMLDPGSVVREGEFASVQNSGGVPESVMGMYNKLIGGGVLTQDVRDAILREAQGQYATVQKGQTELTNQYRTLAERAGLNADDVVLNFDHAQTGVGGGGGDDTDPLGLRKGGAK